MVALGLGRDHATSGAASGLVVLIASAHEVLGSEPCFGNERLYPVWLRSLLVANQKIIKMLIMKFLK